MLFPRRGRSLRIFLRLFFATGSLAVMLRAEIVDYAADARLSAARLDPAPFAKRFVPLSEVLALIERQAELKFVYDADRVPLAAEVVIEPVDEMSVARLLAEVSSQVAVVFRHRNGLVAVWPMGPDDVVAAPEKESGALLQRDEVAVEPSAAPAPVVAASESETAAAAPVAAEDQNLMSAAIAVSEPSDPGLATPGEILQLEKFKVEGAVVKGSASDLRDLKQKAAVSIDYLSSTQLTKYAAGDLSEVVFRMPGISVAGGQFAVVRGLSDRFLSTTLNGIKLPTPDPEKQAVQLDLLPVSAVEAIVVSKTYQSSLWAESSGGNMDILTRTIPSEQMGRVSVGLKVNSNTRGGDLIYKTSVGIIDERLGKGTKSRLAEGSTDPKWQYVPSRRHDVPIGNKLSVEYANSIPVGEHTVGILISAFNEASYKTKQGLRQNRTAALGSAAVTASGTAPAQAGTPSDFEKDKPVPSVVQSLYDYEASEQEYVSGLVSAVGYQFSPEHELRLAGVLVQSGIDQSQISETTLTTDKTTGKTILAGPSPRLNFDPVYSWLKTNEYYRQRNLSVLQASGEHKFIAAGDLALTWALQHGRSYQKDHPFIESEFVTPLDKLHEQYLALSGSDAPIPIFAVWADNQEKQNAGRVDLKWPFRLWGQEDATVSFGVAMDSSKRDVVGTGVVSKATATIAARDPNAVISRAAGAVGGIFESASGSEREIRAYYANLSLPLFSWVTLVGGARFEDFSLNVSGAGRWGNYTTTTLYDNTTGGGQFGNILGTTVSGAPAFNSREWYPGAGLNFKITDKLTTRLAYSQTSGRPSFREVMPFFNKSIETGNLVVGNPALLPSEVTNMDVRIEWNPSRENMVSLSYFRKQILNPIEKYLLETRAAAADLTETWINNPGEADVSGFEFEFRHGLGTWLQALRGFTLSGNFTKMEAEVPENPLVVAQNARYFQNVGNIPLQRRLFDQPEYIGNLDLSWSYGPTGTSATLALYAISDTLSVTGLSSFNFDLYDRSYRRLDFSLNQQITSRLKLKFAVKNLTDPVRGLIYDRNATAELIERNTFRLGREFNLTLSADY